MRSYLQSSLLVRILSFITNTLTEISELQCMIGGKITIAKHGQTDSVLLQHSENTTPLEVSAVNPAIEMPKEELAFPVVENITIKQIED